ncbi:PRKCA-binding protein isoform X2 [Sitodiplosis mosellana]|uniref:PRKCA-binding protein isoform X2 n=1 Tax=Sitodiplosis mosellana TaxID=263140 RepID=UPI002444473E|nr:PRKCA-binding protein isoform X2 [Sitodiplosis mosellana]
MITFLKKIKFIIKKDQSNLIGISIGGGAPYCPCLYIVQVFDGTPTANEGTLQSGDELLGVNGQSAKGKTKVAVAKMIQSATNEVTIHYNKLHADPTQGESLDIALKKLKHRFVEGMSSNTADSLGLSRAILCNDSLVKRLQELQSTESMYRGLVEHSKRMLKAHFDVIQCFSLFGRNFAEIREPQQTASETFRIFSEMHRNMEKDGLIMLKAIKPVLSDLGTYLMKAIPDTKLTIRRYADAKFTYLSYCLKVKELDDEEHTYAALQDPLYRVETGNYEYRLILRCRQEARAKFASLRNDVLEKLELLESKHAQDLVNHLRKLIEGLANYSRDILEKIQMHPNLFPIEVDLKPSAFQYKSNQIVKFEEEEDEEEIPIEMGVEALTTKDRMEANSNTKIQKSANLIAAFEEIDLNDSQSGKDTISTADNLLVELGIADIDLSLNSTSMKAQSWLQRKTSTEQSLNWLAEDLNTFSAETVNDTLKFNANQNQDQERSNNNNANLLD